MDVSSKRLDWAKRLALDECHEGGTFVQHFPPT